MGCGLMKPCIASSVMFSANDATLYKVTDTKDVYGVNEITYTKVADIKTGVLEPLTGTGFELEQYGLNIVSRYKVFTTTEAEIGQFIEIFGQKYRIDNIENYNGWYYGLMLYRDKAFDLAPHNPL